MKRCAEILSELSAPAAITHLRADYQSASTREAGHARLPDPVLEMLALFALLCTAAVLRLR